MRCDEIFVQGSGNIGERVLNDFLYASLLTSVADQGLIVDHTDNM